MRIFVFLFIVLGLFQEGVAAPSKKKRRHKAIKNQRILKKMGRISLSSFDKELTYSDKVVGKKTYKSNISLDRRDRFLQTALPR